MEVSSEVSEATEEMGFILPGDSKTVLIGKVILEGEIGVAQRWEK